MFIRSLVLSLVVLSLSACNISNISGSGQKGPFKEGSTVSLSKLNSQANPIVNKTKTTQIQGTQGLFSADGISWNGWTEVTVEGEYFNEFENIDSSDSITLNAISKKNRRLDVMNVHLYSHLAAARIKQHVENGVILQKAWKRTQKEMRQFFGLKKVNKNMQRGVEQLSLTHGSGIFKQDNANLLLFTGSFLANGGDTESLQALAEDFSDDAEFNGVGEDIFNAIALTAATDGLLKTLSQNLKDHGAHNPPSEAVMPELPIWVNTNNVDTVAPVISIGSASVSLIQGTTFVDDVAATDNVDGNITANIAIGGDTVDTNIVGSYTITYNVSDSAGNAASEVTRNVTVTIAPDTIPPVISVGSTSVNLIQGTTFVDDVAATDNVDGNITANIAISGDTVDTNVVGIYNIIYNVEDAAGNAADSVIRNVSVILPVDITSPVITITDPQDNTVEVNSSYSDLGATANDERDGVVTVQVDLSNVYTGTINNTFDVVYTASDAASNTSTATRTVTVVDTIAPVITVIGGDVTITEGTAYVDAGVTTTDNSSLEATVEIDNHVDINRPSIYTVTYIATDTVGNSSTATRMVTVKEDTAVNTTEISGMIRALDGTPILRASINVYKNGTLHSQTPSRSGNGNYSFNLDSNQNYVLVFVKPGYATQVQPLNNLTGATLSLNIVMLENSTVLQVDPTIAFTGSDNNTGTSVILDANDFGGVDTLQLTITPLDTSIASERNVIPGDLYNPLALNFLGLAEFTFINRATNEVVDLVTGQTAEITIPIFQNIKSDGSAYVVGDDIKLYYLNEDTGLWVEEGAATVIAEANSPTGLAAKGDVSHFTWWALSYASNSAVVGNFSTEGSTFDVVVSSDEQRAFIADHDAGVKILDISNFNNIGLLGEFVVPSLRYSHIRLSNDESKLFALSESSTSTIKQIEMLDISDPSNITSLFSIPVPRAINFELSSDNSKLFVASGTKFEVIDITIPSAPVLLSNIESTFGYVRNIALSADGNTAFLAYGSDGLVIVDLTDLNNISIVSSTSAGAATGIAISPNSDRAYVTYTNKTLRIFDTSNFNNPVVLSVVDLPYQGGDVVVSSTEDTAYVASWESGLQVVDTSNSNNPTLVANVSTSGLSVNLAISQDDKYVFLADKKGGFYVIDTEKALLGDSIPPTITLVGDKHIIHPVGTPYIELGASAIDDLDGAVTVEITGTVDVDALWSLQEITYTASDSSGNHTINRRTIFIDSPSTYVDPSTHRIWQDTTYVIGNSLTWENAVSYCENLVLNGDSNWRLPEVDEMIFADLQGAVSHSLSGRYWLFTGSGGLFANFYDATVLDSGTEIKTTELGVRCILN